MRGMGEERFIFSGHGFAMLRPCAAKAMNRDGMNQSLFAKRAVCGSRRKGQSALTRSSLRG